MNPAQVHLTLNHIPIIGLAFVLVYFAFGIIWKHDNSIRISMVALIIIALSTIPVFYSGEPAEEIIEETTSVSHDVIHEHEEAGEFAFVVMEILGGLAIIGLILMSKGKLGTGLRYLLLLVGLFTFILMARVGNLGGKIMHPEKDMEMPVHQEHEEN